MKKQSFALAFFASIVQFYDYALFGLSASMLTKAYMPFACENREFLNFFIVLSAATLMRPVGSLIFGYIGDYLGRAFVLKIACMLAAISTLAIGLIPENTSIFSAACMIICRMIFMMSQAGESDGVRIYVAESIGSEKEHFGNGLVTCCSQIGALCAAGACFLASKEFMPSYWWRVNFIIGGLLGLIIFAMRARLEESGEFINYTGMKNTHSDDQIKAKTFFFATVVSGAIGGLYHFYIIFFGTYISKMTGILSEEFTSAIPTIVIVLYIILAPLSGYLANKFEARLQVLYSLSFMIILTLISISMMANNKFEIWIFLCAASMMPFFSVPLQIMLKRIMPVGSRLRVFSITHSLGSMIFSSSVPLICSWMWYNTGFVWLPVVYITGMGVVLLITISYNKSL